MEITIKKVATGKDLRKFINYPYTLYKDNKFWCPPMRLDDKNTLSRKKNPAFEFCEAEYFLAYQGKNLVGRRKGQVRFGAHVGQRRQDHAAWRADLELRLAGRDRSAKSDRRDPREIPGDDDRLRFARWRVA